MFGAICGKDAERIADFVFESRLRERNLEVPHFLARTFGGERAVREQARGEGVLPGKAFGYFRFGLFEFVRDRCHAVSIRSIGESGKNTFRPCVHICLVIHIAIRPRMNAFSTERFQTLIALFPELTERRIIGVAERDHGKLCLFQSGSGLAVQPVPKPLRIIGRIAVAVGAGDD